MGFVHFQLGQNNILESALECEIFINNLVDNENGQYASFPSLYMDLRKDEEFVERLFYSLNINRRKSNTQLVAFKLAHDEDILRNMFHDCNFPFYYDDKGFQNGEGMEGPFQHDGIDLYQIGIQLKAFKLSENIGMRARLLDTARALGINVLENEHHSARYDCWLATQIFKRHQENLRQIYGNQAA